MKIYFLLLVCIFCMVVMCFSDNFMVGYSHEDVVEMLGNPIREIKTGTGVLLFYGSVFLEVVGGTVLFINVHDVDVLERRRIADAKNGVYWGKSIVVIENITRDGCRSMTEEEIKEWTERRKYQQDIVVGARVRRFLLTETLRKIFGRVPLIQTPTLRYDVGKSIHLHNISASGSSSVIGIKDSQGGAILSVGESTGYTDRYISFSESFFGRGACKTTVRGDF